MKHLLFLIAATVTGNLAFGQSDTAKFFFKEVGLSISVPAKFEAVSAEENERLRQRGEKTIEEANQVEVDVSATKDLLTIKLGPTNYLNITITPYASQDKDQWEKDNKLVKELVYGSFVGQVSQDQIDTASSTIALDGLVMDRFEMTIRLNASMNLKMILLSRLYKGYDFGICYVFVNPAVGREFEQMVLNATFKK